MNEIIVLDSGPLGMIRNMQKTTCNTVTLSEVEARSTHFDFAQCDTVFCPRCYKLFFARS